MLPHPEMDIPAVWGGMGCRAVSPISGLRFMSSPCKAITEEVHNAATATRTTPGHLDKLDGRSFFNVFRARNGTENAFLWQDNVFLSSSPSAPKKIAMLMSSRASVCLGGAASLLSRTMANFAAAADRSRENLFCSQPPKREKMLNHAGPLCRVPVPYA